MLDPIAGHSKLVTVVTQPNPGQQWVLLSYRVPREPSTPRIAIWRRLKNHGVVQIGDGLVALPFDARTKEHLEWIATMAIEADGEAIVWVATTTKRDSSQLAARMNADRDGEYQELIDEIAANAATVGPRTVARFRRELRRIDRRDYFRSSLREAARQAVETLANAEADIGDEIDA